MAITASGLFVVTHMDILDATQLAIDYDRDDHKLALFTNSITPNFSTDTAYTAAPYTSNEVSGTGYTAGGTAITSTALSESPAGTIMFDAADTQWTTSTITNARGGLGYAAAAPAGSKVLFLVNFGADFSTVAGTFLVQWAAGGIWTWDLTP